MLHMLGQTRARAVAVPGRRACRRPETRRARRARSASRRRRRPIRRSCASRRRATPAGSSGRSARSWSDGRRGRGRRRTRARRARRDVRVHGRAASRARRRDRRAGVRRRRRRAAPNRVVVGPAELLARAGSRPTAVRGSPASRRATARSRPRSGSGIAGTTSPAVVELRGGALRAWFSTPQRGVAPGQSVVVYRGRRAPRRRPDRAVVPRARTPRPLRRIPASRLLLRSARRASTSRSQDLTLHITAPDDFAEESRAAALSFWETAPVLRAPEPGVPTEQAADRRPARRRAPHRPRDGRGGHVGGRRSDVHVPRCRRGSGRPVPRRRRCREVTVACDGDYFIQARKRQKLAVDAARWCADRGGARARRSAASACRRRSVGDAGGGGPDGLAVIAYVVHARRRGGRRRAGAPAEGRRVRDGAALPPAGARRARRRGRGG